MTGAARQSFSVDIAGLLEALTEQFPEPLLCVRELVQNAADAAPQRIETDVAYDASRHLFRLSVHDDGRGMNEQEIEGYLTIGFSEKDPASHRGRFGVGKLSPYALGIERMVVETCDGQSAHRITFNGDGSGMIAHLDARPRGTVVRVYKRCDREEAERLAETTYALVRDTCGSLPIPLFVNGVPVNRDMTLPTIYFVSFAGRAGQGVLGIAAEASYTLMGGGIVLETGSSILGNEVSYILDSPKLAPTLSRNAVRRDQAFDELLRASRAEMPGLTAQVASRLRMRAERFRQEGVPAERALDATDRAALEWLRSLLLEPEEAPSSVVREAPVLETADGGLVSAQELIEILRREGRVPISRVPRTRDEISAYADRGVPVLLLYRDLEDFLERQGIETVEVDGLDDGVEIAEQSWGRGEEALARRRPLLRPVRSRGFALAFGGALVAALVAAHLALGFLEAPPTEPARRPSAVIEGAGGEGGEPARVARADLVAVEPGAEPNRLVVTLASAIALLSAAAGCAMIYFTLTSKSTRAATWLRAEAGAPLTVGETRRRRLNVLSRAIFHPIDFFVARGWSVRASGPRSIALGPLPAKGYRELAPEPPIRSGVRLDLDRVKIGFIDLVSHGGDPHDGRILIGRADRVLLNRNHPTVRDLIRIAESDRDRAGFLLDALLATDPDLARGTDPRQVEWDLLSRAEYGLRRSARER